MKKLMLSIQPQYTINILNRDKILEIRKTVPKEWKDYLSGKTKVKPKPMKCLIYCTKKKPYLGMHYEYKDGISHRVYTDHLFGFIPYFNGFVVAEFMLKEVDEFKVFENGSVQNWNACDLEKSCLTYEQISNYVGRGKTGYALHIDDLKIYDMPRELGEFKVKKQSCYYALPYDPKTYTEIERLTPLTRPFQSWGYVEEIGGKDE